MNNATRKFFEVFVEFYTEAGPEPITDDLIERFEIFLIKRAKD